MGDEAGMEQLTLVGSSFPLIAQQFFSSLGLIAVRLSSRAVFQQSLNHLV